jgi:hypothetical protein
MMTVKIHTTAVVVVVQADPDVMLRMQTAE